MRSLKITDVDGLAANTEPALIVLDITRREIESGNIASMLDRLHVLTDTRDNAFLYRESLVFQVRGYDFDRRELPEIPEVRAFFQSLVREWPHWMWFLHRGVGALGLLFSLLCDVRILRNADGSFGTEFSSHSELAAAVADMLGRGKALFVAHGISETEAGKSAATAVDELLGK